MSKTQTSNRVLAEYIYDAAPVERGYTGQTLYVNLSQNTITAKPVTDVMKEKFIGGRGFGLWLLWHGVNDDTQWNDPENEIVISSGPCGGITQYPGCHRGAGQGGAGCHRLYRRRQRPGHD
jgi:aldehyde:ferredoxin oxidoreductase